MSTWISFSSYIGGKERLNLHISYSDKRVSSKVQNKHSDVQNTILSLQSTEIFNFQFAIPDYFALNRTHNTMTKTVNFGHKATDLRDLLSIFSMYYADLSKKLRARGLLKWY